jgi:hypothetical protein
LHPWLTAKRKEAMNGDEAKVLQAWLDFAPAIAGMYESGAAIGR